MKKKQKCYKIIFYIIYKRKIILSVLFLKFVKEKKERIRQTGWIEKIIIKFTI